MKKDLRIKYENQVRQAIIKSLLKSECVYLVVHDYDRTGHHQLNRIRQIRTATGEISYRNALRGSVFSQSCFYRSLEGVHSNISNMFHHDGGGNNLFVREIHEPGTDRCVVIDVPVELKKKRKKPRGKNAKARRPRVRKTRRKKVSKNISRRKAASRVSKRGRR